MIERLFFLTKAGKCLFYRDYTQKEINLSEISKELLNKINENRETNIIYDFYPNKNIFYRKYSDIFICYLCDELENELAIIDFINLYVLTIEEIIGGFDEMSIILNIDKVHIITNEYIIAGVIIELNKSDIKKIYKDILAN